MDCSAASSTAPHHLLRHHSHRRLPFTLRVSAAQAKPPNRKTTQITRRHSLIFISTSLSLPSPLSLAADQNASTAPPSSPPQPSPDTTVTDRVFMDFSICPNYFRSDRTLGDEFTACQDAQLLGRVVFGLYGKLVPLTVSNFKAMCTGSSGSSYKGTLVQKILPGQYFVAGRQGRRDKGEVRPPLDLTRNTETVDSKAFVLGHSRAGVLSLCLSENDDDEEIKLNPNYRNVEFLTTTGPGPCPQLDGRNIVFGAVLEAKSIKGETLCTVQWSNNSSSSNNLERKNNVKSCCYRLLSYC